MELSPLRQQKDLLDIMGKLSEHGTDADELPNGEGAFGLVASNPIPCKTPFGATAYLNRLQTDDGAMVVYDRLGCVLSAVSPHPIDCYAVRHSDGRDLAKLYISPYHKRNSRKAPQGFSLIGGV
jgi:hypothetical protein